MSRTELVLTNTSSLSLSTLKIAKYFLLVFLFWTFSSPQTCEACLCHLIPNYACPPPPHCCESGQYTYDECGCCLTCAKSELQPCGGASGSSGKCAQGLACLKTCTACKTIGANPEPCLFPFEYQGRTFDKCTTVDATESGTAWCATEVFDNRTVIDGRWGDCDEGCPGARHACDDRRFSILIGKCINPNVPGAIPNWVGAPPYRLLDKTTDLVPAPFCSTDNSKRRRLYANTCRCAEGEDTFEIDLDGSIRGNCTGVDNNNGESASPVWCFLENIRDPSNPSSGCYPDTTWSPKDGRFWSADACNGLPPLDIDESESNGANRFPLGEKNPLFKAALNVPFKKPEEVFELKTTTKNPTTKPRRRKTTTALSTLDLDGPTPAPSRRRITTQTTTTTTTAADPTNTDPPTTTRRRTTTEDIPPTTSEATTTTTTSTLEQPTTTTPATAAEPISLTKVADTAEEDENFDVDFDSESDDSDSGSDVTSFIEDYKAFFEDDDDFIISTTEKEATTSTASSKVDAVGNTSTTIGVDTTVRVGRNPVSNQQSEQYYDESEDYVGDEKTDFTDIDDLYYFDSNKEEGKEFVDEEEEEKDEPENKSVTSLMMNLPIVNQREDGIEFLPTPLPSTRRRQKINVEPNENDLSQEVDGSDPPPLTTRRTTEASLASNNDETTSNVDITTSTPLPSTGLVESDEVSTIFAENDNVSTYSEEEEDLSTIASEVVDISTSSVELSTNSDEISSSENVEKSLDTNTPSIDITAKTTSVELSEEEMSTDKMSVVPTKVDSGNSLVEKTTENSDELTTSQDDISSTTTTTKVTTTTAPVTTLPTGNSTTTTKSETTTTTGAQETTTTTGAQETTTTTGAQETTTTAAETTTTTVTPTEQSSSPDTKAPESSTGNAEILTTISGASEITTTIVDVGNTTTNVTVNDGSSNDTTQKSDVTQAHRSPKSQNEAPKIDLGIFGSFWLEKPVQVGEVSETERPSPVFRVEDYTDRFPI